MAFRDFFGRFSPKAFHSIMITGANRTGPDITWKSATAINVPGLAIGGTLLSSTPAELNLNDNAPGSIAFAAAAGGTNVAEVTITVKDAAGATIAAPFTLTVWLSDAATGAGLTGTTASGTVTAKAASGAVFGTLTAKKALVVQTLATGIFVLEITDTAKTGFYVCASLPSVGSTKVSAQLVTGNYG